MKHIFFTLAARKTIFIHFFMSHKCCRNEKDVEDLSYFWCKIFPLHLHTKTFGHAQGILGRERNILAHFLFLPQLDFRASRKFFLLKNRPWIFFFIFNMSNFGTFSLVAQTFLGTISRGLFSNPNRIWPFLTKKQALKIFFHLEYVKFWYFFINGKKIFAHYFCGFI